MAVQFPQLDRLASFRGGSDAWDLEDGGDVAADDYFASGAASASGSLPTATAAAASGTATGRAAVSGALPTATAIAPAATGKGRASTSAALPTATASAPTATADGGSVHSPGDASGALPCVTTGAPGGIATGGSAGTGGGGGGISYYPIPSRAGNASGRIGTLHVFPVEGYGSGHTRPVPEIGLELRKAWQSRRLAGRRVA